MWQLKAMWNALLAAFKDVMISQASNLDKEDLHYIGIKYFDAESNPNKSNANRFLLQLTSCLHKNSRKE
jgi:hypothetical protein